MANVCPCTLANEIDAHLPGPKRRDLIRMPKVSRGGFDDYLAYLFRARKIVILESVRRDNAIYVFGRDWKKVSQLTKAEVLSNRFHVARIVHTKGWKTQLARLMARTRAA